MPIRSWTDDLPKCQKTGVGFYRHRVDGSYSDLSDIFTFSCHVEGDTFLYGIFDPHNGTNNARFSIQRMAAEILFGQLNNKTSDEEIKDVLRNAFLSVERDYIESIDGIVAERTSLQYQLPEGILNSIELPKYRDILSRLKRIDQHLSAGSTAVVALVHQGKLYVANIGEGRALLCKTDENSVLRVVQLSIDHGFSNEDELLRLSHLGLDVNRLRNVNILGNQCSTRCLGNYLVKGLYQAYPEMNGALNEPVIAIPEIHGPVVLDESCRFLILVSDGIYKCLEEATNYNQVNKQLVQMTVESFRTKSSLAEVSQSVVERTVQMYEQHCAAAQRSNRIFDTMTMLIRNFNFPQAMATQAAEGQQPKQKAAVRFDPVVRSHSTGVADENSDSDTYRKDSTSSAKQEGEELPSPEAATQNSTFPDSSSATDTSSDLYSGNRVLYDRNRRIEAYVNFGPYYENMETALRNGTLPPILQIQPNQQS